MTSPTTPDTPGGPTGKPAGWKKSAAFGTAVSFGAAVLLLLTTAWHGGFAANTSAAGAEQTAAIHAQQTPTISHAIAGGRDSYADIVKAVAPAVITVQADSRATPQATGMQQMPDSQF